MRKIFLCLMLGMVFVGCMSDKEYIDKVKERQLDTGETAGDKIVKKIQVGEFYLANIDKLKLDKVEDVSDNMSKKEFIKKFGDLKLNDIPEDKIQWKLEKKMIGGKTLIVSTQDIEMRIETQKNSDYIDASTGKVQVLDKKNNKIIPNDALNLATVYYDYLVNHKEKNNTDVMKTSDDSIEYYPDGYVKSLKINGEIIEFKDEFILKKNYNRKLNKLEQAIRSGNMKRAKKKMEELQMLEKVASSTQKTLSEEEKERLNELKIGIEELKPFYDKMNEVCNEPLKPLSDEEIKQLEKPVSLSSDQRVIYYKSGRVKSFSDENYESTYDDEPIIRADYLREVRDLENIVRNGDLDEIDDIKDSIQSVERDILVASLTKNIDKEEKERILNFKIKINQIKALLDEKIKVSKEKI